MNLEKVLKELLGVFEQEKFRCALIGGVALDWNRLWEYYRLLGMEPEFLELKRRFNHAE